MSLTITQVMGLALIEDLGRPGYASLGVSPSGAANRQALIAANTALGNEPGACAIELIGACTFRSDTGGLLALAGAPATVSGAHHWESTYPGIEMWAFSADEHVTITSRGVRTYIAFRGGLDVPLTLGSGSYDTLSELGVPPLAAGDTLPTGTRLAQLRTINPDHVPTRPPGAPGPLLVASVYPGPRDDWVEDLEKLFTSEYKVSTDSNRVGIRLLGPALTRAVHDELPSEGLVRGAIQIPPSGQPVIFGPDHPTTGGYPVVGVLAPTSSDALAHASPGQAVRFRRAQISRR